MSTTDPTSPDYDADAGAGRPYPAPPPPPPSGTVSGTGSGSGSTAYPPPPVPGPPGDGSPAAPSSAADAFPGYAAPPASPPPPSPQGQPYPTFPSAGPSDSPYAAAPPPAYGAASNPYAGPGGAPVGLPGGGPVPPMSTRLLARIIDWVIMSVAYALVSFVGLAGVFSTSGSDGEPSGLAVGALFVTMLVFAVIGIAYEVVLIALRGATIGKQVMGIKVVQQDSGAIPGWGPSLIRWGIPQLANFICGLGIVIYLSPFWADSTGRQRGYHDQAASTVVVSSK